MSTHLEIKVILQTLTHARLSPYKKETGSWREAVSLYEQNVLHGVKFMIAVQFCEVALRNEINSLLVKGVGLDWYQRRGALIRRQFDQLQTAKDALKRSRKRMTNPNIVAALPMGFWVGILGKKYEKKQQYWRRFLYKGFCHRPKGVDREELHDRFDQVRIFRNRVAHHDRLVHRRPQQELDRCLEAIGWICPHTRDWTQDLVNRICFSTAP